MLIILAELLIQKSCSQHLVDLYLGALKVYIHTNITNGRNAKNACIILQKKNISDRTKNVFHTEYNK